MKKYSKKQKVAVALGAGAIAVSGAGAAIAYWTAGGTGSGSAATGTTTGITINQTSTVTGLYPGGSAQTLSGDFTNSNASAVQVAQVSVAIDPTFSVQTNGAKPACTPSDFTLVQPTATNTEVPSGTHVGSWGGASIALKDTATNQDNCKSLSAIPLVYTSN